MRMFAGDLFVRLAEEGRLVLTPAQAEQLIAGLERTLAALEARARLLADWHAGRYHPHPMPQPLVDALFAEQLAPGGTAAARAELPKYVTALRRAAAGGA